MKRALGCAAFCLLFPAADWAEVPLPTPPDHYRSYDSRADALALATELFAQLSENDKALVSRVLDEPAHGFNRQEAAALLERLPWRKYRARILEIFLHEARVLEVIPEGYQEGWQPLVHDALLFFLDRLAEDRLLDRLFDAAALPRGAERGARLLAFVANTPTLQKVGQILARNPALATDFRGALQVLENSVRTTSPEGLAAMVREEVGEKVFSEYQIHLSPEVLAEASVGAVMRATLVLPGEEAPREAVAKIIKPYALRGIREELSILDELTRYLEDHRDAYAIGATPLVEMFKEVREAFAKEVEVAEEQQNLIRAREYYRKNPRILVPAVFPCSTRTVTFMEYVEGEKITDAFRSDPKSRARLARRLSDALTYDVLFSGDGDALFHGDPHAGNVFHVRGDPKDPYRIALLDWGLYGRFSRSERAKLAQLLLGVYLRNPKRLEENVGALVEGGIPATPEARAAIRAVVKGILAESEGREPFELLETLITRVAREGYPLSFTTTLYVKSQITIGGILAELDPRLKQGDYLMSRLSGQVWRELPMRFLRTIWFPAWNSHDYRSLLSNEDVRDVLTHRLGKSFKKKAPARASLRESAARGKSN